jgi:PAS domain S-box-containing protein
MGVAADDWARVMAEAEQIGGFGAAAQALGHSERRRRAIIDNTPSMIAVKDLHGRYLMANAESGRVVGMAPERLVGSRCVDLFPDDVAERLLAADRRAAAEGTPVYDEAVLLTDGDERTYATVTSRCATPVAGRSRPAPSAPT